MRGPFSRPLPSSPQNALHSAVHATHLRACVLAQRLFVRRTVRGARAAGLSPVLDEHMQAITKLPVEGPNRLLARTALELYRALQHANQGRRHERVVALLEEALVSATRGGFAMGAWVRGSRSLALRRDSCRLVLWLAGHTRGRAGGRCCGAPGPRL